MTDATRGRGQGGAGDCGSTVFPAWHAELCSSGRCHETARLPTFSVVSDSQIVVTAPAGRSGLEYEIDFFTASHQYFSTNFAGIPMFTFA